jgi:AraC-like DNA-binding protein
VGHFKSLIDAIDSLLAFLKEDGRENYPEPGLNEEAVKKLGLLDAAIGKWARKCNLSIPDDGRTECENSFDHLPFGDTYLPYLDKNKLRYLRPYRSWYEAMLRLRRQAEAELTPDDPADAQLATVGNGDRKKKKRKRKRRARIAELLLALLDDQRFADMTITRLAGELKCHPSTVSRAFSHSEYGPSINQKYRDHHRHPPTIDQI